MAVTAPDVLQRVADALKKDLTDLSGYWSNHAAAGLTYGQQEVQARLVARGFTIDTITAWARYDEFVSDLALYRALILGGMLEAYDTKILDAIDRRRELKSVQVYTVADGYVDPDAGSAAPGVVQSGNVVSHGKGEIFDQGADGESPITW